MKTVLVTGVSSGIGRGIATVLGRAGWHVYGSVRKAEDAAAFESALAGQGTALVFDVTDEAGIAAAAARLTAELGDKGLDALVNNAGISINGPLELLPLSAIRQQFEVNLISVVAVTQAFLPLLGAGTRPRKKPGKIINISSIGGRRALPFAGPYCATKFALEGLSDSWRRELMVHGIDVILIEPGAIKSEIWSKALNTDLDTYDATPYATPVRRTIDAIRTIDKRALPAEDVGKVALLILSSNHPKTRYIVQEGGPNSLRFQELLPDRLLDRLIAGRLGIKRRK